MPAFMHSCRHRKKNYPEVTGGRLPEEKALNGCAIIRGRSECLSLRLQGSKDSDSKAFGLILPYYVGCLGNFEPFSLLWNETWPLVLQSPRRCRWAIPSKPCVDLRPSTRLKALISLIQGPQ